MALIKRREGFLPSLRSDLQEFFDVDKFFNEPFSDFPFWDGRRFAKVPATNIHENKDEFVVEVAAPGLTKKDFHLDIDNNMLEIKVEKEKETKEEKKEYTRKEYDYSGFVRSFTLPETVKTDKIRAEYENGILMVHLPKVAVAKKTVKEIPVA